MTLARHAGHAREPLWQPCPAHHVAELAHGLALVDLGLAALAWLALGELVEILGDDACQLLDLAMAQEKQELALQLTFVVLLLELQLEFGEGIEDGLFTVGNALLGQQFSNLTRDIAGAGCQFRGIEQVGTCKVQPGGALDALAGELSRRINNTFPDNAGAVTVRYAAANNLSVIGAAKEDKDRISEILQETWESADDWFITD